MPEVTEFVRDRERVGMCNSHHVRVPLKMWEKNQKIEIQRKDQ